MYLGAYRSLLKSPAIVSAAGEEAFGVTYVGTESNETDLAEYTFTNVGSGWAMGAEASNREFIIAVQGALATNPITVSSLTFAGEAASPIASSHVNIDTGGVQSMLEMYRVSVPTGSTATNCVVNFSASSRRCNIGIWRVAMFNIGTPATNSSGSSSSLSVTPTIPTDGVGIFYAYVGATSLNAWTNLSTEDFDTTISVVGYGGGRRTVAGATAVSANIASANLMMLTSVPVGP